jgi:hypothetical protein
MSVQANPNLLPSDQAALVDAIDPDAYAAAAYSTAWIAAKNFAAFMATVYAGTIEATGTVDAKLQQATDSSGTGVKDVTGKAITQLTAAGTDSDKQAIINCRAEELDVANGFDYLRLTVTLGTAGADMGAALYGFYPRYGPASDNDAASVDEIVS